MKQRLSNWLLRHLRFVIDVLMTTTFIQIYTSGYIDVEHILTGGKLISFHYFVCMRIITEEFPHPLFVLDMPEAKF